MKVFHIRFFFWLLIPTLFIMAGAAGQAPESWTHFRGDQLDAVAAEGPYPVFWNDSTNVAWKTAIPGRGWSSPLVLGTQVWLTTASADGKDMDAICLDRNTGEILFKVDLFEPGEVKRKHAVNSYATPTGAIEKGFVYAHFGRYGTACIDTRTGEIAWKRTDMQCEHVQGPGSSLLLHRNMLIVHMEGTDVQDIYALDKTTGETIWKVSREPEWYDPLLEIGKKAYITPVVISVDGRELLISNGSAACDAFDVKTGERVWYIVQGEDSTIAMPVVYGRNIFLYTSFVTPPDGEKYCELWCIDPRGEGDLSGNILWRLPFPILQLLTPVIHDGLLYTVDTESRLHCIDAGSGEIVWSERLKGKYNSSPVFADGNVYVSTTRGKTLVFKAGSTYQPVGENQLDGEIWSTPAFVDGAIFMRTSEYLYRIEHL